MYRVILAIVAVLTIFTNAAEAKHRHHHYSHHRAHVVKTSNTEFCGFFNPCQTQFRRAAPNYNGFLQPSIQSWQHEHREPHVRHASVGSRPSDCYGIAWCGCYLRHVYGIADKRLNLARAWASVGSNAGGPHVGAVVVWAHHVGKITGQDSRGNWIVLSGNSGRAGVTEVPRSIKRAIAFRDI